MRRWLLALGAAVLSAAALAAAGQAAYLEQARLAVVRDARFPTWKLAYLLCHASPGQLRAEISEFTYRRGEKARTVRVWSWGRNPIAHPSSRGGRCSWYQSAAHRSTFPQRAGYVSGVTLEIFDPSGQTITRTFRLHP